MSGPSSIEYHRLRAAAELMRAEQAADPKTAALHRELAELHRLSAGDGDDIEQTGEYLAPADDLSQASG